MKPVSQKYRTGNGETNEFILHKDTVGEKKGEFI